MELVGRRWDDQQPVQLAIRGDRIERVEHLDNMAGARPESTSDRWLGPGLIDLQVNGYDGYEFTSAQLTPQNVQHVSRALLATGVTGYLATVTTQSQPVIMHALQTIHAACQEAPPAVSRVLGVHLEGPYLSPEDGPRGAHPRQHCRLPDWDEYARFQQAAGGRIRLVTLAPELPGAADFIRRLCDHGVVAAVGHTAATSEQIEAAVQAGARLSTHLGNGAHPVLPRHPNYLWDQLADDRLWASLIADGFHLPPAVLKVFLRAKGLERCLLVSDVTGMGGRPPGRYRNTSLGDVEILEDGRLVVGGQRTLLAGAAHPLIRGVAHLIGRIGVSLYDAWSLASTRPAELLGLPPQRLQPGEPADVVQFALHRDGVSIVAVGRMEEKVDG
jgi:N-acetylglucosamine-6-phosphate deacetylase